MTGLSLLTQGDWAEGTAAHNGGTMAAPLVLMGDTCNRIRGEDTWGGGETTWRDGTPVPPTPKNLSLSCPTPSNLYKTRSLLWRDGCLPTVLVVFDQKNNEIAPLSCLGEICLASKDSKAILMKCKLTYLGNLLQYIGTSHASQNLNSLVLMPKDETRHFCFFSYQ